MHSHNTVNQDDVARVLSRTPINDMHKLMAAYEHNGSQRPWYQFVRCKATEQFLLSHGWLPSEYAKECAKCTLAEQLAKPFKSYFVDAYVY